RHALVLYNRAYCRDRLEYDYYAAQDFRNATALPVANIVPKGPHAAAVLRLALARDPLDTTAWYLLAVHEQGDGRTDNAREALRTVLRLRPGHPDATALLAKTGGAPPARSPTSVAPAPSLAVAPP